ncbi:tRNA (guanosine(46)-N7)-methyltransferase TrmB [Gephyromycinifex aptenodytis]|uniref:tRNA (guanosine(46)-N7)-methyltransferase TrmB n=1 Tax=Gephyromycinifex aptenodytis TaxID=2716227 RepID=UPI001D015D89|nr:tRNA (guanosine(46)-N7)-methyltransferase TrmB [Gephyromycinifex aptenodytis]
MPQPLPGEQQPLRRDVMSFARRDGRLSHRYQQAWDEHHSRFVVEPARLTRSTSVDPTWRFEAEAVFGRRAPLVVEIGSGTGDAIIAAALAQPERDHLAVEVYRPGIARTIVLAQRHHVNNLRVIQADARALVDDGLEPHSVSELRVFFPDPWPKARHHKRRLIDGSFAAAAARVLEPGGALRLATDWQDYADVMREVCDAEPLLSACHDGWAPRFEQRPLTRFERKGLEAGRAIRDLEYQRRVSA